MFSSVCVCVSVAVAVALCVSLCVLSHRCSHFNPQSVGQVFLPFAHTLLSHTLWFDAAEYGTDQLGVSEGRNVEAFSALEGDAAVRAGESCWVRACVVRWRAD